MSIEWQVFENLTEHPTLEAIVQVLRALRQLEEKPESQIVAEERLQQAAKQASLIAHRENKELSKHSLLRKVARLDECLGSDLSKIFREWQNPNVTVDDWREILRLHRHEIEAIHGIAEAYQRTLQLRRDVPSVPTISVQTTRLLNARFWPQVLHDFYKEARELGKRIRVELSTIEPYAVLDTAIDGSTHDLLLTYCDTERDFRKLGFSQHKIPLHRCLIGAEGKFDSGRTPDDILRGERIGLLRGSERIMPSSRWAKVLEEAIALDYQSTTLAVHAYCRNGCGVGMSHYEFLDELEQKELEVLDLPPDFGHSTLVCLRPKRNTDDGTALEPDKAEFVSILERLVHKRMDSIKVDYARSTVLTKMLKRRTSLYMTATRYESVRARSRSRVDAFRGTISVKVTPSLFVQGTAKIANSENDRSSPESTVQHLRLFGRIRFSKDDLHGQMVLRAMNRDQMEISMASILVEQTGDALRCPGIEEPCLIGHWVGKDLDERIAAPNAGIWIWHEQSQLSLSQIRILIKRYHSRYPISILPDPGDISDLIGAC